MKKYFFVYRDLLKYEVLANSLSEALNTLADKEVVFGIHPLDYDYFYLDSEMI